MRKAIIKKIGNENLLLILSPTLHHRTSAIMICGLVLVRARIVEAAVNYGESW